MRTVNIISLGNCIILRKEYKGTMPYLPRVGEDVMVEFERFKVEEVLHDFDNNVIFIYVKPINSDHYANTEKP